MGMYIEYYVVRASASQTRPTHLESEMCTQRPLNKHENKNDEFLLWTVSYIIG
jgi:hypothetical protein